MRGGVGDEEGHELERYQSTYICGERAYMEGGDGNRFQREGEERVVLARVYVFFIFPFLLHEGGDNNTFQGEREKFSSGYMYVCMYIRMYVCMYVCIYVCMCVYVYLYVYGCM